MKNLVEYLNFEIIISEIKKSGKRIYLMIFLMCIFLGTIDFILRKHGINEDWFTHGYITVGAISFVIWAVKLSYNIQNTVTNLKEKTKQRKNYEKLIKMLPTKSLDVLIEFAKTNNDILRIDNLQDELLILQDFRKLELVKEYKILSNTISIIFEDEVLKIIKEAIKIVNK